MKRLAPSMTLVLLASCGSDQTTDSDTPGANSDGDAAADAAGDGLASDASGEVDPGETDTVGAAPTLEDVSAEIFEVSCSGARCHTSGGDKGDLALDLNSGLMDRLLAESSIEGLPIVTPGDPDQSYLYLKLTQEGIDSVDGDGVRMPLGRRQLPSAKIELVRAWIASLEL